MFELAEIEFIFLTMFVFLHFQTAVVHHLDVSEPDDLWINAQVLIRAKVTQKSSVLIFMNFNAFIRIYCRKLA